MLDNPITSVSLLTIEKRRLRLFGELKDFYQAKSISELISKKILLLIYKQEATTVCLKKCIIKNSRGNQKH
jgi:hypothetical protein